MLDQAVSLRLDAHTVAALRDLASTWQVPLSALLRAMIRYTLHSPHTWPEMLAAQAPEACTDLRTVAQQQAWERDAVTLVHVDLTPLLTQHPPPLP